MKKVVFRFKKTAKIPLRKLPTVKCYCSNPRCKGFFIPIYFNQKSCIFTSPKLKKIPTEVLSGDGLYKEILENIKLNHKEEDIIYPPEDCYFLSDSAFSHGKNPNLSDGK